jgi:hypothetical protein
MGEDRHWSDPWFAAIAVVLLTPLVFKLAGIVADFLRDF